jgi:acetoin utilization deacetylase AcuC-like enzyme
VAAQPDKKSDVTATCKIRVGLNIIALMETLYITHPLCRLHEMGDWHPESPQRLDAIADQLVASGLMDFLKTSEARPAQPDDLLRVHTPEYLAFLREHAPAQGYFSIDDDTAMNPGTLDAARMAAGAGLEALDQVLSGQARTAFCAIRPPGHHARPDQALGFCFFNNVAVAARYALDRHGLSRVAIVDFDVHHGNGTEEIFLREDRVMMCSFYQYPFFPGMREEHPGPNMINVPVEAYSDGAVIRDIVSRQWLPALRRFQPELILISAGFDAHREDDMGSLKLVEADYAWLTQQLVEVAAESAQGRIVSFLEGGYSLSALGRSVAAHVRVLGGY